ncbi:hypothetical protein [Camelimonas lactis]|uniref:Uncharacterized protein n=1 Tax=Camelimonas lactis TaxID=659006 RepID=A0A4R2GPY2_9HYPH|nr:hypothetical protein [Camelimonas lactis]TCO11444.1 hypothetical protein EV666_11230 [Camelimonas lactis]
MTSIKANFVMAAAGLALATLASTVGLARSADSGAGQRPPNVPANYVLTPYGYVAPQDIVQLRKGETVAMRQARRRASGDVVPGECSSPRFSTTGVKFEARGSRRSVRAYTMHYLANAAVNFPRDYQTIQVTTDVVVPPPPTSELESILYLVTGLHDTKDLSGPMVQSVVSWKMMGFFPGWTASNWFDSEDDDCFYYSRPVSVTPGQTLRQTIEARQNNGKHEIQASVIDLESNTPVAQTTFMPPSFNPDEIVNIGMWGIVSDCDRMPAGGEIRYPNISANLTISGEKENITDKITVRPATKHICDIALTLDE